jgi:hypothetical protein
METADVLKALLGYVMRQRPNQRQARHNDRDAPGQETNDERRGRTEEAESQDV